jgi:methyl-accepting chemotaxis protein
MSSQGVFEEIRQSLEEVVSGRRYLIAEMEKLRKAVPDLGPTLQSMAEAMKGLEGFVGISQGIKHQLDGMQSGISSVNNMAVAMESMRKDLQEIANAYSGYKPLLEAIRQSSQKQEQGLIGLNNAIGQLGSLMGNILAKLG